MGFDKIEKQFMLESGTSIHKANIPYVIVDNFPQLGLLTSLKFLKWVSENPEGVISLPTGKTPEFFIKWTHHILNNWDSKKVSSIFEKYDVNLRKKPSLRGLHFVQIDEFYPIDSRQKNSFYDYVQNFYIKGFDLDPARGLFINSNEIELYQKKPAREIFPDHKVDLSLRFKECKTRKEKAQQESIFMIDNWCGQFEEKIRKLGGIGFFLGGIGPDGHIAFNVRGSDFNSTTRLTETNFETQAAAATDLGGIEISRNRLVITIGLATITYNPEVLAIIIAAGEAKASIVKASIENEPVNLYPASCLQKIPNSRFYLTSGAATQLTDYKSNWLSKDKWTPEKTKYAIIELCKKSDTFGDKLTLEQMKNDPFCSQIPGLNKNTAKDVIQDITKKITSKVNPIDDQVFLHTGPHHDDIMLGYLPYIIELTKTPRHKHHFSVLTSGFTSVTNQFLKTILEKTKYFINNGQIQMIKYPDFFNLGYRFKWDKDIYHYLVKVAANDELGQERGVSHRIVRALVDIYSINDEKQLLATINEILATIISSYDGEKNPPKIQKLKGMIREFEEELVWAHFGVQVKNVSHLRLGFYTGDIFTEQPDRSRDVKPILELMKQVNPGVITLALDPEGSGPDTHYKVLQAIAEALRLWKKEKDISNIKIWGYRNVWYRFHPSEADIIVPVSLNGMAILRESFLKCYLSQKSASFPSYELDGTFNDLSQKIWCNQLHDLQLLLGKNYFYENDHPQIRAAHGIVLMRELSVDEFLKQARRLEKSTEGAEI